MQKIKILLNIPFNISHEKLVWLIERFEEKGFEVLEESASYAGCFTSEIPSEIIDKCQFLVTINDLLFFHKDFFKKVSLYIMKGIRCFGCERIVYGNNDMGLQEVIESKNPRIVFVDKLMVLGDFMTCLNEFKELYSEKPLVAAMLEDAQFIAKTGAFYNEKLTAKMLNDGSWGVKR